MGSSFCKDLKNIFITPKRYKILILGGDASGKTTALYQLKYPTEKILILPTNGFNLEQVNYKDVDLNIYDVTFNKNRPLNYSLSHVSKSFKEQNGILFFVDSYELKRESYLAHCLTLFNGVKDYEPFKNLPIVIVANKQDVEDCLIEEEIVERLQLNRLAKSRPWFIRGANGKANDGLKECLDWLLIEFKKSEEAELERKKEEKDKLKLGDVKSVLTVSKTHRSDIDMSNKKLMYDESK